MSDTASSEEIIVENKENAINEAEKNIEKDIKSKSNEKSKTKNKSKTDETVGHVKFAHEDINIYKNIYIVFVEPESSGNIGFVARTMANFGLKNLILINPSKIGKEAYYYAMHAKYIVENVETYETLEDFIMFKKINFNIGSTGKPGGSYNLSRIAINPSELSKIINFNNKIAIIFGREGNGLNNAEIGICDVIVSIPTSEEYPIMNVSHAVAIILYELFKDKNKFSGIGLTEANTLEKQFLVSDLEEIVKTLNLPEHKQKTNLKTFKNIINRAFITGREAHTLKGLFRKIKLKLRK
ncbi:MAG: TrmJ/YjtD family RNA methyltransferase [Methanobrevibacter sp.]|jgi:TrmH family RNA methyltransferase|nr:TrmJ/YjtD family RNA methyltransferase [Candidatus Methanovirga australis]